MIQNNTSDTDVYYTEEDLSFTYSRVVSICISNLSRRKAKRYFWNDTQYTETVALNSPNDWKSKCFEWF